MVRLYPERSETVAGLLDSMQSGMTSSNSIVEKCLSRIDEHDPELRAWVSVNHDEALATAAERDRERRAGQLRGVLHGIPIGIKDIVDVKGMVTAAGSMLMAEQAPSAHDAALVTRLRDAGAIILGKTVTTQFASFDPPPTRNPWNATRTPGGSSSGSAVAVATGMCPAAIGSQTGGSITRPASFCGVIGCKPTFGTVPVDGVYPLAKSLDHPGLIARSIEDLTILLPTLQSSPSRSTGQLAEMVPPRIGRLRGFYEELMDPALQTNMERTLDRLMAAGCFVYDVEVPADFDHVKSSHRIIMAAEAAAWHRRRFTLHPNDYLPCVASLIEEGLATSAADYISALDQQQALSRQMNELISDQLDVLLTPATTGPAPDASTTGDPSMNSPWSFTGMPTVSLPSGLTSDGLPLGIQLAGRHNDDNFLIRHARFCESILSTQTD